MTDQVEPTGADTPVIADTPAQEGASETAQDVNQEAVYEEETPVQDEKSKEDAIRAEIEQKVKIATDKRFAKIIKEREELAAKTREYEERLARVEAKNNDAPKIEDFETEEEYLEAKAEFLFEQRLKAQKTESEAKAKELRALSEQQALIAKAQADREKVAVTIADFPVKEADFERMANEIHAISPDVFVNVRNALFQAESPASVVYHLASNPDQMYAFLDKTPAQIQREINFIEFGLQNKKQEHTPKPKPPSPVGTKGVVSKQLHEVDGKEILKRLGIKS